MSNAQRGGGGFPGQQRQGGQPSGRQQQTPFVEYVDTFGVFYLHEDNPTQVYTVVDSSLNNFHRYDPAQQPMFSYANNGTIGTPARPIFYESRYRQGFDIGLHQFDLYYIQPEDVRFYVIDKPYAKFRANIGNSQEDNMFEATFGRKFANGWHFNLDASSIQEQSGFKFPNQQLSDRSLGVGLWHKAKSGRYDGFFTVTSNTTVAQENGGITSLPTRGESFTSPANAETLLSGTGETRHAHRTIGYTQYFKIRKRDSIPSNRREFTLSHQIQYRTSNYKYIDDASPSDSLYYHSFLEDRDERGLRFFLGHQALCNSFKIGTYKTSEATAGKPTKQHDRLEVGLIHRIHFLDNDIENSTLNNVFVTGRFDFRPNERLAINTSAHLGLLGNNIGDYRASGDLFFDIGKIGQLSGQAVFQAYEPGFLQQDFIVTQQPIWSGLDLNKVFENNLSATYTIPSLKLSVTGGLHSITNYIYLAQENIEGDTLFQMKQLDGTLAIPQLAVQHRLKLGILHFNNTLALQPSTEDRVLRLPTWLTRHSLYIERNLFESALRFQFGVDLAMNASYFADSYQVLIGQFYLQNDEQIPVYPALDAFLNVNVKTVRVYVKAQNIAHLLSSDYYYQYYQTHNYPQLPFFIGFGLDWVMRN